MSDYKLYLSYNHWKNIEEKLVCLRYGCKYKLPIKQIVIKHPLITFNMTK